MGDMADDAFDHYLRQQIEFETDLAFYNKIGYWMTKNQEALKISELSDSHLMNIERMLRKNRKLYLWPSITNEIKRRGLSNG